MHCSFLSLSWTLSTQVMTARILHSAPHPHRISEIMQHCHRYIAVYRGKGMSEERPVSVAVWLPAARRQVCQW